MVYSTPQVSGGGKTPTPLSPPMVHTQTGQLTVCVCVCIAPCAKHIIQSAMALIRIRKVR